MKNVETVGKIKKKKKKKKIKIFQSVCRLLAGVNDLKMKTL